MAAWWGCPQYMGSKVQIGLAVGGGTDAELASAFEQVIGKLGDIYAVRPVITRSCRIYGSYFSLLPELDAGRIEESTWFATRPRASTPASTHTTMVS